MSESIEEPTSVVRSDATDCSSSLEVLSMSEVFSYQKELQDASLPLMQFLEKHHNPHVKAIVDSYRVEVVEGLHNVVREGFQFRDDQPSRTA